MALYELHDQPDLDAPVMIVVLEGWIDAGYAAGTAIQTLLSECDTYPVATFDADQLLDHRARRPIMHLVDGVNTGLSWPGIELRGGTDEDGNDLLLLLGAEPDHLWRGFTEAALELAQDLSVRMVVGLGAYPATVPHSRAVTMSVTTSDPDLASRSGLLRGTLEVPAGVQAAIELRAHELDLPAVGLWAQVPHYVSGEPPYPAASLALLRQLERTAGLRLPPARSRPMPSAPATASTPPWPTTPSTWPCSGCSRSATTSSWPSWAAAPCPPTRPCPRPTSWPKRSSASCATRAPGPSARPHRASRRRQIRPNRRATVPAMLVDGGIGSDLARAAEAAEGQEALGFDGLWAAETNHDPFLALTLAAEHTERIQLGTGIAVAFARSPMTLATTAYNLNAFAEGRFLLGLGSQIKPHIERRFSMPWLQPAARMQEFISAMRAIWASWADGTKLSFEGDFYTHTLMTPFFDPGPNEFGAPKVFLAAVGERMTQVAGEVADGLLCHGFTTESYLREVTLPNIETGLTASGRTRADLELSLPSFIVTGRTEEEHAAAARGVREQIAFYGSTPAYRGVLEHHGWGDLQTELKALSKEGRWADMGTLIDDDILGTFAVVAEPDAVGTALVARFGDLVDRLSFYAPYKAASGLFDPAVAQIRSA